MTEVPALDPKKSYFGTTAQKRGEYETDAHRAATLVEGIYHDMIGAKRDPRSGKPMLIRDWDDFRELKRRIREAETAVNIVLETYAQGHKGYEEIDDKIRFAKTRLTGEIQAEYKRIKARITKALGYEEEISGYRKDQAIKSANLMDAEVKRQKNAMEGREAQLFEY